MRIVAGPDDVGRDDVAGDTAGWDGIDVPGTWVLQPAGRGHGGPIYLNIRMPFDGQPPDVPPDNPTAVYRRRFTVPASWRRRRTHLRVGSADSMGFVWVNGSFVGLGTDSHLASTYDITDLLAGGPNDVCIVVPRWSAATWMEDQDQWWMPGLHRSVELVSVPPISLADTALVPGLDATGRPGRWTSTSPSPGPGRARRSPSRSPWRRSPGGGGPCWRRCRSACRAGLRPIPRSSASTATSGRGHVSNAASPFRGIEAWNHESPTRYRAIIVLRDEHGATLDVRTRPIGFRRVEIADRQLLDQRRGRS